MGDHDEAPQLFDQLKVCIVCSKDLSQDSAQQLASTLEENGADPFIYEPPAECQDLAQFNYLMSATIDFPGFDAANDALIPVVKPQWMHASLSKGKLANVRQYSPDPRLFLNDVTVTCGDIPEGDKDAIIGGVLAKGGTYNPKLTAQCTHLVDLTADSDKAQIVKKRNLTNIKIVLPHWFDDCLKLGKRIDERPYTLPDPEILRSAPDAPIRATENRDIIGASTPEPTTLPTPITSPVKRKLNVFHGKVIMLSPDLKIGSHLQDTISTLVKEGGGEVTSEVSRATTLICRYREGFAYRVASRLNKDVGNLAWLYHLMTYNTWTSPYRRLLHYPVPHTPIPGFENLKISLSNYVGEARSYLENLITATGAEPTKTLRQDNTHLVTAHDNSEKVNAAKEWGLLVVNHLWLEESYAKWRRLPESEHRYTHFPRRTNLGEVVGQTRLDRSSLESMFFPSEESPASARKAMGKKDQNIASRKALSPTELDENTVSDTTNATPKVGRPKKADSKNLQTPARSRLSTDGKENDTPSSTSSRKSKDAATAKLHEIAPDIALYEKEMKRVGGVIYGGRRKTDEDRVEINKSKKRSSMEAQNESEEEDAVDPKRQKRAKLPPIAMHLLITGYKKWVGNMKKEDADKRQLRELGITVVQDARKCSHVAAPSVLRTPKFVNALAYGPVIVRVEFIEQCLKKNELLDADDYPLNDKEAEKKYDFSLEQSKVNAKANKNKLLQGYQIYCVETIRGGFDAFKSIVDTNGGVCNLFRGRVAHQVQREESEDESDSEQQSNRKEIYLLSSAAPEHQKLWPRFRQLVHTLGKTPRIVRVDWLLDMAMSQVPRTAEDYELNEEMVEQSEE
ncbi:BRCT domain-containing protein [Aspergillus undulatus]|uniref:BRCT domain-containing protein n=1 Tax=Aspergillus undulatus TaxID=1810928 RepID=UPI003CCCE153